MMSRQQFLPFFLLLALIATVASAQKCFDDNKPGDTTLKDAGEECDIEPGQCLTADETRCLFIHNPGSVEDADESINEERLKKRIELYASEEFKDVLLETLQDCELNQEFYQCFLDKMKETCPNDPFLTC